MKSDKTSRIRQYFKRYATDVEEALNFLDWWDQTLNLGKPSIAWTKPVYRIVYGNYNPISIAGSLAAGGRFNIGGSQVSHFFPQLRMEACLYAASSIECAKKEAGDPLGKARLFNLKPNHPLKLWDLHYLIHNVLNYPALETHVNISPMGARWDYQKAPKISQILGSFLRKNGGDGLLYPSTKDKEEKTFAFFAKDDNHMHQTFVVTEIAGG